MKLAPLDDRVVIKQSEAEEKSCGRNHTAGCGEGKTAKRKNHRRRAGQNVRQRQTRRNERQKRRRGSFTPNTSGNEIEIDGEKYVILHEGDILGVIEK